MTLKYEKWADLSDMNPEEVSPEKVYAERDDSLAEGHVVKTGVCCDIYYRILLDRGTSVPMGFVGVVSRTGHGYTYRALIEAGAYGSDKVAHINEFYPLFAIPNPQYEQCKRRGVGTKVMSYVLDDLRKVGFEWAYMFLSEKREAARLMENFAFTPIPNSNGSKPNRYFKKL